MVTVRCDKTECIYCSGGYCQSPFIEIDEDGKCTDYIKPHGEEEYIDERDSLLCGE